jgi:hypothetical protein
MSDKCGISETSHNWIGDACADCGVAWPVWVRTTIKELERQLSALKDADPDTPAEDPPSRRTKAEVEIIDELYRRKGEYKPTHAYVTVTQPVVLRKWNGDHYPSTEANITNVHVPAGTTLKIVMVSRFGDCGLTDDLDADNGYSLRVDWDSEVLSNIRWKP